MLKEGDAKKYEDFIDIYSLVKRIRNWDMTYDYYV